MAKSDENHMFVSHYHEDEEHIKGMKELLGDSYKFKNSSVTSDKFNRANNPDYIKTPMVPNPLENFVFDRSKNS